MEKGSEVPTLESDAATRLVAFENRLADSIPLSPIGTGLLITAVLLAGFSLAHWALGIPLLSDDLGVGVGLTQPTRVTFLVVALIGFTAAANLYLPRAIYHDQILSMVDDPSRRKTLLQLDPLSVPAAHLRASRWAGVVGILVSGSLVGFLGLTAEGALDSEYHASAIFTPILFWMLARSVFSTLAGARAAQGPPEFDREIDLFDLRPHFVSGRTGLRLALVWLAGTSISVVILFTTGMSPVMFALVGGGIAVGIAAFVMPVRELHLAIRAKKRAALDAVRLELQPALYADDRGNAMQAGRLADLLALRTYLEGIREWPFDNTTLWRFGLYAMIPLGSWVGGALVERLLSIALS